MPKAKKPQMTVAQLAAALTNLAAAGHGREPVFLYSDQEGNEVNGIHELALDDSGLYIIPRHWSQN